MEDRKNTDFFLRCFLEYSKPILSLSSISPPKFAVFEIFSKLKLDWMFAAEGAFFPAEWFSSCCQA